MFGDYTRSTPNKIIFTPASDYVLEARNTSGIVTSNYSATRQWGTKPKGGIYDPYAANLVLAIPGGAVAGITSTFDVTGQIKFETPTSTYVNAGIVTYSNSLGIGTYQNKTTTVSGNVSISSTIAKYYSRSIYTAGSNVNDYLSISSIGDITANTDFCVEMWVYVTGTWSGGGTGYPYLFGSNNNPWGGGGGLGMDWGYSASTTIPDTNTGSITWRNMSLGTITMGDFKNKWNHLALTRSGGSVCRFFYNGVQIGQATQTGSLLLGTDFRLGTVPEGGTPHNMQAYFNDFRVTNGSAKYTSNFTPPNQIYLT